MGKRKKIKKSIKRIMAYCKERTCSDCMFRKYGFHRLHSNCPVSNLASAVREKKGC